MFLFCQLFPVVCLCVVLCCCVAVEENSVMGKLNNLTARLATLLVLHAVGAGLASPTVLITKPIARVAAEWLPTDNQTMYKLGEGERRSLELNTSTIKQATVFITISPCTKDFHWALYYGKAGNSNGHLTLKNEDSSGEMTSFYLFVSQHDKYLLQLSSTQGSAGVISVRGEPIRQVRLRLRVRSRRRLAANWDPSPIDPQETRYCVVASHRRNYTSLCAAQYDIKANRLKNGLIVSDRSKFDRIDTSEISTEVDNKIEVDADSFSIYDRNFKNIFRRKKIGRSTKVTDEDPVIACVGDRTHHLIENLDPSSTYFVSIFGVARDRRSGSLLATGSIRARTSTAKRLRENVPNKADIKSRSVYYFKATIGSSDGAWFTLSTCGGAVDVEVLIRGKRIYLAKNIDPHTKFFVPAPKLASSIQEVSDEGSVQFDSSSEEAKVRFVIKVTPSRWDGDAINVELTASTARWGFNTPEITGDGASVRELRQCRSCRSTYIAFLPAVHNATNTIRYCITARETTSSSHYTCAWKKAAVRTQCINYVQQQPYCITSREATSSDNDACASKEAAVRTPCINRVQQQPSEGIVQKIFGLKPGTKYVIQVAASNKGSAVPYNALYVDTNSSCKEN